MGCFLWGHSLFHEPCLICMGACVCVLLGHPPFRGEEITLDLPNAQETLPSQGRNPSQKVKARKGAFGGVVLLIFILSFYSKWGQLPFLQPPWAAFCILISFTEPFLQNTNNVLLMASPPRSPPAIQNSGVDGDRFSLILPYSSFCLSYIY